MNYCIKLCLSNYSHLPAILIHDDSLMNDSKYHTCMYHYRIESKVIVFFVCFLKSLISVKSNGQPRYISCAIRRPFAIFR